MNLTLELVAAAGSGVSVIWCLALAVALGRLQRDVDALRRRLIEAEGRRCGRRSSARTSSSEIEPSPPT